MAADDRTLSAPVGIGQPNDPTDVSHVQHLLNERQVHGGERLAQDGVFGPRTTARLIDMRNPWVIYRGMVFAASLVALAAPAMAVDTDEQLVNRVRRAVIRHHLSDKSDCMNYRIIRNVHPRVDEVDLFERHDAKCGGDPGTQPRLFNFLIDRETGELATTALDPDRLQYVRLR